MAKLCVVDDSRFVQAAGVRGCRGCRIYGLQRI